jgi:AcrR family transcriptional regulator
MSKTLLPVTQERSRLTQLKLLKAAAEVLDEHGVEGATIPRIAAKAGLSPGAVYRRFPDKDALLREVCLRAMKSNDSYADERFQPEAWVGKPLSQIIELVVEKTLEGHRKHRGILRAIVYFTMEHQDTSFVRQMEELEGKTFQAITALLLSRRKEIRHPDPESAVPFALFMLGVTAQGTAVLPRDPKKVFQVIPHLESRLAPELTRMLLRYLGLE